MLDRFLRRWTAGKPPPRRVEQAALWQRLGDDLLQTLGQYTPGGPPVVYSPIQTRNQWSRATLVHEEIHRTLTINTTYGLLYQTLALGIHKGLPSDLLSPCLREMWGVQEGTATYSQLVYVAIDDPAGLDEAVSLLPSEELGQPPYREWFDRLAQLLPVRPVRSPEDLLRASDEADLVLGLALYALNPDIFGSLPPPAEASLERFEAFLEPVSPDRRLVRTIACLRQGGTLDAISRQFRLLCERRRAGQAPASAPIDWLMGSLALLNPGDGYVDNASRLEQSESFVRAWSPASSRLRTRPAEVGQIEELPPASQRYVADWVDRFPDAFAPTSLTLELFRSQLVAVLREQTGLACSIAMHREDELHLTTMPYPRGADADPSSWEDILKLLDAPPTREGVFVSAAVQTLLEEFTDAPLWVQFIGSSWRVWDRSTTGRRCLRRAVQSCVQVELSEPGLRELLAFRQLEGACEYRLFPVYGEQYAVCFFDPRRPGLYAFQGVQGDAGLDIFNVLVQRLHLPRSPTKLSDLPHANLIRLAGQGFLL
jgi:hypothetical protein